MFSARNGGVPGDITQRPTTVGATVELFSLNDPTPVVFDLPTSNWSVTGSGRLAYLFRNREAPLGVSEVKKAKVERGRATKLLAKATGLPLAGPQGGVGMRFNFAGGRRCAFFGPDSIVRDEADRFIAKHPDNSTVPDCRADSLGGVGSPSGAFLD